jgi:hypothetical protein
MVLANLTLRAPIVRVFFNLRRKQEGAAKVELRVTGS